MAKTRKIFLEAILCILLVSAKCYAQYSWVCIDAGHGGTDEGTHGRVYDVLEKDVNLSVALAVRDSINWSGTWNPIMTRVTDTTLSREVRADTANKANLGWGVDAFICIHHNSPRDSTDTLTNGTETYWCNAAKTDSNWSRDTTDVLARKAYYRLRDQFHYPERGVKLDCTERFKILRLTKMASTLSEASFLTCAYVERLFYYDWDTQQSKKEAGAIFRAWHSFASEAGIVTVKYSYADGSAGPIIVDGDTVSSPFFACWEPGESHLLQAYDSLDFGSGHKYYFNHWNHFFGDWVDPRLFCWHEPYYYPTWSIYVPAELEEHNYHAYMTGGPYSATVTSPNGWEIWHIGEERLISFISPGGADSSSWLGFYLSRDGGTTWTTIDTGLHCSSTPCWYFWTVTGPVSTYCRVKIMAHDCAENNTFDISNYDFSISQTGNNNPVIDQGLHCKYAQTECNDCIKYGESFTLEVHAHDLDHDSMYYEWHCGLPPSGGHFSNGQNVMITPQNYVVYTAPILVKQELYDYLSVAVTDVRGGQNWASGGLWIYPPGFSCLCGDANNDGFYTPADISYLINYLFMGGPPPHEPILKADANNDCAVTPADISYLINYSFCGGPPPECCWIE
jgi:N-acetylmuramoyl-L-alanine amidase